MIEDLARIIDRNQFIGPDYTDYYIYDFDQTWSSTALGFGGVGGSAITTARTYVLVPKLIDRDSDHAYVYFGGTFAYKCNTNEKFWEDVKKQNMASVRESGRYKFDS